MNVLDAGTGMLHVRQQKHGVEFEVYHCPDHRKEDCGMCGNTGFRAVCNQSTCHEHGCQGGCSRTPEEFRLQQLK